MNLKGLSSKRLFAFYLLGIGASYFYNPIAIFTFCGLLWIRRSELRSFIASEKEWLKKQVPLRDRPLWAWLPLVGMGIIALFMGGILGEDDLSRHAVSYRHAYDYSNQYAYADILQTFHSSPWYGFEWLIGHLHAAIYNGLGMIPTINTAVLRNFYTLKLVHQIVLGTAFYLFGLLFIPVFRSVFKYHPLPHFMTGICISLILAGGVGMRLVCGRPEILLMLGMFSVWRLPPRIWVLVMMALQPLYWLSWIYGIGVLFIHPWGWMKRLGALACILVAYSLFWQHYAGLDSIIHFFTMTSHAVNTRMIDVSENLPVLSYLSSSFGMVLLFLISAVFYTFNAQLKKEEYILIMVFCGGWILINQARYLVYLTPCLVVLWARQYAITGLSDHDPKKVITLKHSALFGLFCLFACWLSNFQRFNTGVPLFQSLPANAHILTSFNTSTFVLPALYPAIKIAPPMEVGFANRSVQSFLKHRFYDEVHIFDCVMLTTQLSSFTHVVDINNQFIPNVVPSCLRLKESAGNWRLWEIVKHTANGRAI